MVYVAKAGTQQFSHEPDLWSAALSRNNRKYKKFYSSKL